MVTTHDKIVKGVKRYYEEMEFYVKERATLGRFKTDLVAIRDEDLVIAIEAKPNNKTEIRKGIGQSFSYSDWAHKVYLAVPSPSIDLTLDLIKNTHRPGKGY